MARIKMLQLADMTEAQSSVCREAESGARGRIPAPMHAWIRNPELARHAQRLGAELRFNTSLPRRLSELAILLTARHWSSHYEWAVHARDAERAGLDVAHIRDIARRRKPDYRAADERVVDEFCSAIFQSCQVDDLTYGSALECLGEAGIIDLVGLLGYYGLVSMTLNVFEIGLPEHYQAELA